MFVVTEAAAAAIRAIYEQEGELSAAIEVRRLFPGITDNAEARACARTIAGWKPLPAAACQITPLRLRRSRARPTKPMIGLEPARTARMRCCRWPIIRSLLEAEPLSHGCVTLQTERSMDPTGPIERRPSKIV